MSTFSIISHPQGTQEWLKVRLGCLCASESPVVMGVSKYQTRDGLLREKHGWKNKPIGPWTEKLFKRGHEIEAEVRNLLKNNGMGDFAPMTLKTEIDGIPLLASLDGIELTDPWDVDGGVDSIFECKSWNKQLAENVRNGLLPDQYRWQVDHQLMVSGALRCLFVVSDGTQENLEFMEVFPDKERFAKLMAGLKQFQTDLDGYVFQEVEVPIQIEEIQTINLPAVVVKIDGAVITSNLVDVTAAIKSLLADEIAKPLETDLDFGTREELVKNVRDARSGLKNEVARIKAGFASYADFERSATVLDGILQKFQSAGERQVKEEKEKIKAKIVSDGYKSIIDFVKKWEGSFGSEPPNSFLNNNLSLSGLLKGKRNLDSMRDAVDNAVAEEKVQITDRLTTLSENFELLQENDGGFQFLFTDWKTLIDQSPESLLAVIRARVAAHEIAEQKKIEAIELAAKIKAETEAEERLAEEKEKIEKAAQAEAERVRLANEKAAETEKKMYLDAIAAQQRIADQADAERASLQKEQDDIAAANKAKMLEMQEKVLVQDRIAAATEFGRSVWEKLLKMEPDIFECRNNIKWLGDLEFIHCGEYADKVREKKELVLNLIWADDNRIKAEEKAEAEAALLAESEEEKARIAVWKKDHKAELDSVLKEIRSMRAGIKDRYTMNATVFANEFRLFYDGVIAQCDKTETTICGIWDRGGVEL